MEQLWDCFHRTKDPWSPPQSLLIKISIGYRECQTELTECRFSSMDIYIPKKIPLKWRTHNVSNSLGTLKTRNLIGQFLFETVISVSQCPMYQNMLHVTLDSMIFPYIDWHKNYYISGLNWIFACLIFLEKLKKY